MEPDLFQAEVLIIGGGPSGLSTALHLVQLDPGLAGRIRILEKKNYPRPKLCAGGLVADAEILLQGLGLDVNEIPHVDARQIHLDFAGRGLTVSQPKSHALRIIRRDEFDAWLAGKAAGRGIQIRENVTVKNVQPEADGVRVVTDQGIYHAPIVVGADGSNGVTRRCILPNAPVHTARLLEVLTPEPAGPRVEQSRSASPRGSNRSPASDRRPHRPDQAYFDFFPVPAGIAGYTWDFPTQVNGQPMRCWGVYDTNLLAGMDRPQLQEPLAEEMRRHGFVLEDYEVQGYPIRWFSPFHPFSTRGVILVGDAAGADGIFGEGISIALGYGKIAAQAIRRALARRDFSFHDYRRRILFSPLGQALSLRTAITHLLYSLHWAGFQKLFWRLFKPVVAAAAWLFVLNWAKRMK